MRLIFKISSLKRANFPLRPFALVKKENPCRKREWNLLYSKQFGLERRGAVRAPAGFNWDRAAAMRTLLGGHRCGSGGLLPAQGINGFYQQENAEGDDQKIDQDGQEIAVSQYRPFRPGHR